MPSNFIKKNSHLKIFLSGDIDLEITMDIKSQLMEEIDECSSLDIDGSRISYIDSSGISILVIAMQICTQNDITFTMSKLSEQLMRVIELAHLENLLPIGEVTGQADTNDITDFENNEFTDGHILHDLQSSISDIEEIDDNAITAKPNQELAKTKPDSNLEKTQKKPNEKSQTDGGNTKSAKSKNGLFKPGTF